MSLSLLFDTPRVPQITEITQFILSLRLEPASKDKQQAGAGRSPGQLEPAAESLDQTP
jgi:hypothetical protein